MSQCRAHLNEFGRRLLVMRVVEQGWPVAHAAKAQGVSRQCAHRWINRWRAEGEAGLADRSSRPHTSPHRTSAEVEARIVAARVEQRRGQDWLAAELGVPARTVSRVLRRNRLPYLHELDPISGAIIRASKATAVRYERERPGELVHVDVKKIGKIPDDPRLAHPGRSIRRTATLPPTTRCCNDQLNSPNIERFATPSGSPKPTRSPRSAPRATATTTPWPKR